MRRALVVAVVAAAAAAGCGTDVSRPARHVRADGEVADPLFSADGKALLGRVFPRGADLAGRPDVGAYVLWDVSTGKELARPGFKGATYPAPGSGDGTVWPMFGPFPSWTSRFVLADLTAGRWADVPGVPGPKETCSHPSLAADGSRLAYSDYRPDAKGRRGHVYARDGGGWAELVSVPGEAAKLSADGTRVATVTRSEVLGAPMHVRVWSVPDGKEVCKAPCRTYGLRGFTADGKYVIHDGQGQWALIDAATGEVKLRLDAGDRFTASYAAGAVLQLAVAGGEAALVRWDAAAGKETDRRPIKGKVRPSTNRTRELAAPRLAVVYEVETRDVPGRPQAWRWVQAVEVFDPAKPDSPPALFKVGSLLSDVLVSPDGRTLAAVSPAGVSFFDLPAE